MFLKKTIAATGVALASVTPFQAVHAPQLQNRQASVTYQIVTNEIKSKTEAGKTVEAYRFDPGVFVVLQGNDVELKIFGLKGHDHPVQLEGYHVTGVVRKHDVTSLKFKATKAGIFRLICESHADMSHQGPMEGYLVVVPK